MKRINKKKYILMYPPKNHDHKIWIAGSDKPHRCPDCYAIPWPNRWTKVWRVRKYFPRMCKRCGAITLSTFPKSWWGKGWF